MFKRLMLISCIVALTFCFPMIVRAANGNLKMGDFDMECTYENGVTLTFYYDSKAYGIESSSIKLSNAIQTPLESEFIYFYNESAWAKEVLNAASCPNKIVYSIIVQYDDSGNSVSFPTLYRESDVGWAFWDFPNYDEEAIIGKIITGFNATEGTWVSMHTPEGSILASRGYLGVAGSEDSASVLQFYLKSERIHMNKEVDAITTYSYKSVAVTDQAATKPTYIRIMKYNNPAGNLIFLAEKDQSLTNLNPRATIWQIYNPNVSADTQFTCFNASTKNIETNKNDTAYSFSQARHSTTKTFKYKKSDVIPTTLIKMQNNPECVGVLYQQISTEEYSESDSSLTSVCELIPESALVLAKIINWIRILVPAFLIILTGVDITKIVIAGNLEEELPKRRKGIIIRFIVVIFFFFLPVFVQTIFSIASSASGNDYGDISCLWE